MITAGLNKQQKEAVEHFGSPLLVLAGAGSGKTKVITTKIAWLIKEKGIRPNRILAITFTKKAAREMQERVERLLAVKPKWISTFHSFCVRILRENIAALERNYDKNFAIYDEHDSIKMIKEIMREGGMDIKHADSARGIISKAKQDYRGDIVDYIASLPYPASGFVPVAAQYLVEMEKSNALDYDDIIYLAVDLLSRKPDIRKHWQERFDYILVDEYQDTNRIQYLLINLLVSDKGDICVVGDPQQCIPAHTMISIPEGQKRIDQMRAGDKIIAGVGQGKTAIVMAEKILKRRYKGPLYRIIMKSGRSLEATPEHICFSRLEPLRGVHYVYLMQRKDKGFRIGVTTGVRRTAEGVLANGVQVRTNQEVSDKTWILHSCHDGSEARYFEQLYSLRYGIPTAVFHTSGRNMDQVFVDRLYQEIDTADRAGRLMADLRIDPNYPHHRPFAVVRNNISRQYIWLTMFGDTRSYAGRSCHDHRVQLVTSCSVLKAKAQKRFRIRDGQRGTWRIETSRKYYDDALVLARDIQGLDDIELIRRARLTGGKPYMLMPASHLHPGMKMPVLQDGAVAEDEIERVEIADYDGYVFDLSVPLARNFAANEVVVHNCIYTWRGAHPLNILNFTKDFSAAEAKLEKNYRSTKKILSIANKIIAKADTIWEGRILQLSTDRRDEGEVIYTKNSDSIAECSYVASKIRKLTDLGYQYSDMAVLMRMSFVSRGFEHTFMNSGVPYEIIGGAAFYERAEVKDLLAYLRLMLNRKDRAAFERSINAPPRSIGTKTLSNIREHFSDDWIQALRDTKLSVKQKASADRFAAIIESYSSTVDERPFAALTELLRDIRYEEYLAMHYKEDFEERQGNISELVNVLKALEMEGKPFSQFLEDTILASEQDKIGPSDSVKVMTVHAAKGLEFPVVFVAALEESIFPSARSLDNYQALEEERRLFYVAVTRAKERLYLSSASYRKRYGDAVYATRSRYIEEIEDDIPTVQNISY
ncbi:MAG TPA: UvrD-helicase domain-containing protein [Dissulfurispiraceae bacterium]|nr:UvrD-helicase domain-containing protein [Dissulfurispiraceae bacterium]